LNSKLVQDFICVNDSLKPL